jgi:lactoylglutathione lyase
MFPPNQVFLIAAACRNLQFPYTTVLASCLLHYQLLQGHMTDDTLRCMRYLHTMIRVSNLDESLNFYCGVLGLAEVYHYENEKGKFTNVFLKAPNDDVGEAPAEKKMGMSGHVAPVLEITYNWPDEDGNAKEYSGGRNFGHLAYSVENIYDFCDHVQKNGVVINRPPRDGRMAFIKSPDGISIEILQEGEALPSKEPWDTMENTGTW